ncbi:MAG TPA: ThiF family adenylyltransferase [Kofleriaceae bacterium]|jgi:molybdopterin/thiamine biosynthesis adenylyltransferase|nr:ThiF family adenylyltransferase [Kofleriaceae bacterium]
MKIVVCGVGALGSTAVLFIRNLGAELRVVDFDRVETKNVAAQWFVKQSVGKNKAEAIRLQLANFYGGKAEAMTVKLVDNNAAQLLDGCDLAVDCFDNADSRLVLAEAARAKPVPLVHAALAADGTFGMIRWDERFAPDREDEAGQATCEGGEHLPLIGVVGATLARAIQDFAKSKTRDDYFISLSGVMRTS